MHAYNTKKQARREAAKFEFFERLDEFGGVLKDQSVGNQALIAIRDGHDYIYPAFQFVDVERLPYLDEILELLGNVSAEAQCTFFLNPMGFDDGMEELPYVVLRDGSTEKQLNAIKREASLFMSPTPA